MQPRDLAAVTAGTITGSALSESIEQVAASAAAAVAVYLIRLAWSALVRRFPAIDPEDGDE